MHWGLEASGPLGCHDNHCAPMLDTAVSRERAQGICWHDRMVWVAYLPQVPGLHLSVAHVQGPRCQFWTLGLTFTYTYIYIHTHIYIYTYIYLSEFLRRYFGLIRRVTKSVTICPPPPSFFSKLFRTWNRTQIVKNLNFLGLPKSSYFLTV